MARSSSPDTTRRGFLGGTALAIAGAGVAGLAGGVTGARAQAARAPVKFIEGAPGTAGALWKPLIEQAAVQLPKDLSFEWVNGAPGQVQLQLVAGAVNVSVYGALGLAEIAARGADIVAFGPALNNHGRWIVRDNSSYKTPRDLIGKKIATLPESSDTYRHAHLAGLLNGFDLRKDFEVIFGPPTANLALFERGDVEGIIAIEPTATRLIARGAREIARVGDLWHQATNDPAPLFLIGIAGHRAWVEQNRTTARDLAELFVDLHKKLKSQPELIAAQARAFGIPASEKAAIELLPKRLPDIYATDWNKDVYANIDRQIAEAVKAGILTAPPAKPVFLDAAAV